MQTITLSTTKKNELVDITQQVGGAVKGSKVKEGLCLVYCPHTTAGLTINENSDPDVKEDILMALNRMIPDNLGYSHSEGNSPAHIKSSLLGCSLHLLVRDGKLVLGEWQGIMFFEGDGPRSRKVFIDVLKR